MDMVEEVIESSEDGAPAAAQCFQEIIKQDLPFETKLQAFRRAYEIVDQSAHDDTNMEVARTLIDMIRVEESPDLRLRYIAILSKDVADSEDRPKSDPLMSKRRAFTFLAKEEDIEDLYRKWANIVLDPPGAIEALVELYSKDPDLDVPPKILEEITEETDINWEEKSLGKYFTGDLIRLCHPRLPSDDKRDLYEKETGRHLPVFITRQVGEKYHHIQLPNDISIEGDKLVQAVRDKHITREEAFEGVFKLALTSLPRMNPEQREELREALTSGNIEARFSTERSRSMEEAEDSEESREESTTKDQEAA